MIDTQAAGANIRLLREERGLTVRDVAEVPGLADLREVYKRQRGESLPSAEKLLALSVLPDSQTEKILAVRLGDELLLKNLTEYFLAV